MEIYRLLYVSEYSIELSIERRAQVSHWRSSMKLLHLVEKLDSSLRHQRLDIPLSPMLSCRTIHQETLSIFYGENRFSFRLSDLCMFLRVCIIGNRCLSSLQHCELSLGHSSTPIQSRGAIDIT